MPGPLLNSRQPPGRGPALVPYAPPPSSYVTAYCAIYTGNGAYPIPGPVRTQNLPCLVSGSWMAGHRQSIATTDKHSHVVLLDPSIEVRDPYKGNGVTPGSNADAFIIYGLNFASPTSPWLFVVFSFVTFIPGMGRKKVVVLDQISTWPANILLKDRFLDANGTLLDGASAHMMDVGAGWTVSPGGNLQINSSGQVALVTLTANSWAWANAGTANTTLASVDIPAGANLTNPQGLFLRATDQNNGWKIVLSSSAFQIIKTQAGTDTVIATAAATPGAGLHTVTCSVTAGNTFTAQWDGANSLVANNSFNSNTTKHGIYIGTDGSGNAGNLTNFFVNQ